MVSSVLCFFEQKTAYEMRISDWSSDVCSSDLRHDLQPVIAGLYPRRQRGAQRPIIHRLVHMDEDGTFGRELRDPFERGRKIGMRRMRAHAQTIENPDVQILIQGTHIIGQDIEIGSISDTETICREPQPCRMDRAVERKSTRLNSS